MIFVEIPNMPIPRQYDSCSVNQQQRDNARLPQQKQQQQQLRIIKEVEMDIKITKIINNT
jgi:hypothetical protein